MGRKNFQVPPSPLGGFLSLAIQFQFSLDPLTPSHFLFNPLFSLSSSLYCSPSQIAYLSVSLAIVMKGSKSRAESKKADSKLSVKKGASAKVATKGKAVKDPNKPKRPSSAFFVFMEEFRGQYKQKHPNNKSVAAVGKAGGDKWKSMSEAEKAPYIQKADRRKAEYEKNLKAYNKKLSEGKKADEEEQESDRSRSEVNDEEEEESGSEEEEDDD
ncbi:hypothetical protein Nepgr_022349 [Nepenthes gracilis]|uniref:HMG box domain-containing protein n=1 Tax=Nepenthes gracilis TaxID=150966 RepID=A0AAD3SYJ7_NEPGR|nr:hypothetical protein Nepgr_022349 [Nepenthes gracilis]